MQLSTFEEQAFFVTARSLSIGKDGSISVGTVFLVRATVMEGRDVILGITNKHVLKDPARHLILDFTRADLTQNPAKPLFGSKHRIQGNMLADNVYFEHPDDDVDLACVNLSRIEGDGCFFRTIDLNAMSATFEEDWLLPNMEVCFVGYPEGFYDEKNNLPILRRGVVASLPKVDFMGRKEFLVDAHVFKGSSGSPVFMASSLFGGQVNFVGVLHAAHSRKAKLMKLNMDKFGIEDPMGLGYVLKPVLLKELVEMAVERVRKTLLLNRPQPTVSEEASSGP